MANAGKGYKFSFYPNIKGKTVSADEIADEFDKKDKRKNKKKNKKNKEDRQNKESGASPEEIVGVGDRNLFAEEKHEKKEGKDKEKELFQDVLETPQNEVPEKWDLDGAKLDTKKGTSEKEDAKPMTQKGNAKQFEATQGGPESEVSKGTAESKTKQRASGSEAPKGATKSEASNGTPKSKPEDRASRSEIIKGNAKLDTKKGTAEKKDAKPMTQTRQYGPESEVSKGTAESKTKQRASGSEAPKGATKSEASNGIPKSKPEDRASGSEITQGSAKLDTTKGTAEKEDVKSKAQKGSAKQVSSTPTVENNEGEEVKIEDVWEEIFINTVEDSVSVVDYILKCKQPLSVICCGERLGDGDGKIAVLVMAIKGKNWFYQLCNNKVDFMEAGKLKQLFSDPELMKVVVQKKLLDNIAMDELRLVGFMPTRWTQEDCLVDSSKWTQSPLDKEFVNKLIERCKALLEFYRVFEQKKLLLPKKEIYEKVNKYVDHEKVREIRKQSKKPQTSTKFNRSTNTRRKKNKKGEHGLPVNQAYRLERENPEVLDYQHQELEEIRSKRKSKRETEEKEAIPEPAVDEHEDTDLNLICLDATPNELKLPSTVWKLRDPSEELLLELTLGSADAEDESEPCNQDQGGDKVYTLSGSSAPTSRDKIEETSRPSPLWPVTLEHAPGYNQLHLDPNYFFMGAPSSVMKSHAATVLQQVRRRALCHKNGRNVEFLSPAGAACVIKRERCALPDGSTYELTSTWIPDPEFKETKEQPSQTEENVIKTTETEIQCEIMKLSF